jgi:hypothetical protein
MEVSQALWFSALAFCSGLFFAVGCYWSAVAFREGYGHGKQDALPLRGNNGRFIGRHW